MVDLETTGLASDRRAEILEFGIITLDPPEANGGEARLHTLSGVVRPSRPLPLAIQRLTGLRDADVVRAPRVEEVASRVEAALAGRLLVAHNAEFEREFLSRHVARQFRHANYLDSQDLLALTHPDAPDLRLESFARLLLDRTESHRALDDARDTLAVLACVAQGAAEGEARYTTARRALDRYTPASAWLPLLGGPAFGLEEEAESQFIPIHRSAQTPVPFDEDAIAEALADGERGRAYFSGYRVRKEQIELARHFVRNLQHGGRLLLEGGTGVGKSLAYLAAAIPFAAARRDTGIREPLVISTRTKLLQDQLLRKDISAAAGFLGHPDLRALSIKGRANYVCLRRLDVVLAEGRDMGMFPEDRHAYGVLMACAHTRAHGEIGSLPAALLRRYPQLRELRRRSVAVRSEQCSREACAKTPGCPFGARRSALAQADLVVANHDLLLRWPPDYPSFSHVVADEAHELAGVADEVYAEVVRPDEVLDTIDEIFGKPGDKTAEFLLPRKLAGELAQDVLDWRREIQLDLTGLGRLLAGRASEYGEVQLPPQPEHEMPSACELAEIVAQRMEKIAREADRLDSEAQELYGAEDAEAERPVARAAGELRRAAAGLRLAFAEREEFVSTFDGLAPPHDRWRLSIRPVSPADAFHDAFMSKLDSLAAVSASLFVAGDAFAALGELELEEGQEQIALTRVSVESPFNYRENMRVVALKPGPELVNETAAVLGLIARELGGRTLGLFTSLRRMNEVAEILDQALEGTGIEILAPRRAADDPAALVERFANARSGAVLLGARTFWQGLDIPGDALQAVVIEKLPFEVPTELRRRREARIKQAGGDAFGRFALGKMLLHLKQMSGRLIRSETDRGIVVIVEGRTDKRYFRRLGQAFPTGTMIRAARRESLRGIMAEVGLCDPE